MHSYKGNKETELWLNNAFI